METRILQATARYAEQELGSEGFRHVSAVVARKKFGGTQAFLDGEIEHVTGTTTV